MTLPAAVPALITQGFSLVPVQVGTIVMSPCLPAAGPPIVFVTTSSPGTSV